MITKTIIGSMTSSCSVTSHEETNTHVYSKFEAGLTSLNPSALTEAMRTIPARDSLEIEIFYEHSTEPSRFAKPYDLEKFSQSIDRNLTDIDLGEKTTIEIKIKKLADRGVQSIYCLSDIISHWKNGSPYSTYVKLQEISRSCHILETHDIQEPVNTALIHFVPIGSGANEPRDSNNRRLEVIKQRENHINFSHGHELQLIPEDLDLSNKENEKLNNFFDPALSLLSLIHIADHTKICTDGSFEIKLKGYKSLSKKISGFSDIKPSRETEIFDIYSWVYSESKISDKIGLARNIISIHTKNGNIADLQKGCLPSIHSNYQIYLKDNIKQYIEIKNKVTDSLQKSSEKASELTKQVGTYFRASVFSVYSFFITIFLIRSINKTTSDFKISEDLYVVFIFFLVISTCILLYSQAEFKKERERFKKNYESLKLRYIDLLSVSDLEKILQNDAPFKEDMTFIDDYFSRTRTLWVCLLSLMFVLITCLFVKST